MKSWGTKSLSIVILFSAALALAFKAGRLAIDTLLAQSPETGFVLSFFTLIVGAWLTRLGRTKEPSQSYLRWSSKKEQEHHETPILMIGNRALFIGSLSNDRTKDLPGIFRNILVYGICFLTALNFFNSRNVALLYESSKKINGIGRYCPDETSNKKTEEPKVGCALVQRAYDLGMIKDLGSCETSQSDSKIELCTLRLRDEPFLHYSARLFGEFFKERKSTWLSPDFWRKIKDSFLERLEHLNFSLGRLSHLVQNAPRSSHHIFTDLPQPPESTLGSGGMTASNWRELIRPANCLTRYRRISKSISKIGINPLSESEVFERVYEQMLFDTKRRNVSGLCLEYKIHWNSAPDSCIKLNRDPSAFLKSVGIAGEISEVIKRFSEIADARRLNMSLAWIASGESKPPPPPPPEIETNEFGPKAFAYPDSIISFQCLMRGEKNNPASVKETHFQYMGQDLSAREMTFPESSDAKQLQVKMYKYLADLMAGGLSVKDADAGWVATSDFFNTSSFPMARLEYLKHTDLFFGNDWLQARGDLLEIYPYYYRLNKFISDFRREYRSRKTRL